MIRRIADWSRWPSAFIEEKPCRRCRRGMLCAAPSLDSGPDVENTRDGVLFYCLRHTHAFHHVLGSGAAVPERVGGDTAKNLSVSRLCTSADVVDDDRHRSD